MKTKPAPTSGNNKLPESVKKACREICTLAASMKDCVRCPFSKYAKNAYLNSMIRATSR